MKRLEIILGVSILLGAALTITGVSWGFIMFLLSSILLSCMYWPLGFLVLNELGVKEIIKPNAISALGAKNIILGGVSGFFLSVSVLGILFKFQAWPGSGIMQIVGLAGMGISLVLSIVILKHSTGDLRSGIIKRASVLILISTILMIVPRTSFLEWRFSSNPEFVKTLLESEQYPDSIELRERLQNSSENQKE